MKWKKFTLETTTEAVDLVCDMLSDLGICGIEVEDKVPITEDEKKRMFIDILPELEPDDGIACVHFYVDINESTQTVVTRVQEGLLALEDFLPVGSKRIVASETEDKDWINNWKEFFKPFRVDDTIVIKPTWEKLTDQKPGDMIIELDPGTAFGTGAHETTKLCIANLKKYLQPGAALLDVGCGSGILSIIGSKLGASLVTATDIDVNAVAASAENIMGNGLTVKQSYIGEPTGTSPVIETDDSEKVEQKEGSISLLDGNVIDNRTLREQIGLHCYDVVVANILADIIIPLSTVVKEFMKPDAVFISSGIIDMKEEEVKEALKSNGFLIVETTRMGDWVSFVARAE